MLRNSSRLRSLRQVRTHRSRRIFTFILAGSAGLLLALTADPRTANALVDLTVTEQGAVRLGTGTNSSTKLDGADVVLSDGNGGPAGTRFYRSASIASTGTALTDYQVKVPFDAAALTAAGKLRADCADVRARTGDGSADLPFYVQGCGTAGAAAWIRVPSIPASGGVQLRLYYGSPSAASTSSAAATFKRDVPDVAGAWNLDDTAATSTADVSSGGHDGTVSNAAAATGRNGGGRLFSGGSSYVSTALPIGSTVTISMWATDPARADGVMMWRTGPNGQGPDTFWGNGVITLNTWDSYNNPFCARPASTSDGAFHHYSYVISPARTELYYDGALCGSGQYRNPSSTSFTISSGAGYDWQGRMDDVRVYSRALTAAEIADQASGRTLIEGTHEYVRTYAATDPTVTAGGETTTVAVSGRYVSPVSDLVWNGGWGAAAAGSPAFTAVLSGLSATETVAFKIRAASTAAALETTPYIDLGTASSGTTFTVTKEALVSLGIPAGAARFVQLAVDFTQASGVSPRLSSYAYGYQGDNDMPETPPSAVVMTRLNGGVAIAPGGWANGLAPKFTWNAAADSQSGVAGYCLYLGTDQGGNPAQSKGLLGVSQLPGACPFISTSNSIDFADASLRGGAWLATSGTPYRFTVKAIDRAGNVTSASTGFTFKFDNTEPRNPLYVSGPSQFVSSKAVTLIWPVASADAAADADSGVAGLQYRIGPGGQWRGDLHTGAAGDLLADDGSYATDPAADYPLLVDGNNVVYFRTFDVAGNVSSATVTAVIKLNTSAPSAPRDLLPDQAVNTANAFRFTWNPPATFTGQLANLRYCYSVNSLPTATSCTDVPAGSAALPTDAYATQPGENTLYLAARDEAGNINYATAASATFTANTPAPGVPLNADAADISVKATGNWKVALSWEEPQQVGAGVASYKVFRSAAGAPAGQVATTSGSSYVDSGLRQQPYAYQVRACDSANNCGALSGVTTVTPTGKFTSPPELVTPPAADEVGTRRAAVRWTTDRVSDSRLRYGTASGQYFGTEAAVSDKVKAHALKLDNLQPGTTYYYVGVWTDEDGNQGRSSELSFTTDAAPKVKEAVVGEIGLSTANVRFTSKGAASVRLLYGRSEGFGGLQQVNTSLAESSYILALNGLEDGAKYFARLDPVDADGNAYEGTIFSFQTPPRPRVTNVRFQPADGEPTSTQHVLWTTNVLATSRVAYRVEGEATDTENFAAELKTEHDVVIRDLQDDSDYGLTVFSRDATGNLASSDRQRLRTALDTRPPVLTALLAEPSVRGTGAEARGQLVVSWHTDEPSSSQVEYGEGGGAFTNKTAVDGRLSTEHVVVISDLPTSKVFRLRAVAADRSGNLGASPEGSAIVSRATESVLGLVFAALEKVFGFLK